MESKKAKKQQKQREIQMQVSEKDCCHSLSTERSSVHSLPQDPSSEAEQEAAATSSEGSIREMR